MTWLIYFKGLSAQEQDNSKYMVNFKHKMTKGTYKPKIFQTSEWGYRNDPKFSDGQV